MWRFFAFYDRIVAISCNLHATRTFLLFFSLLFRPQKAWSPQHEKNAVRGNVLELWGPNLVTLEVQTWSHSDHECKPVPRGNSRKLLPVPSWEIKSTSFVTSKSLLRTTVRKYHDARRQPALLATVSPSTAKHIAVAFILSCWICRWSDEVGFAAGSTEAHLC